MRSSTIAFIAALAVSATTPGAAADLTLKRVMLSSGGVGYFEYETEVDGGATLGLDVPLNEVDDILQSLVVFDSAGGVGSVELPGRDDSSAAFGDIPLDPSALGSALAYLNGLQGVEVAVTGPREMTGRILHAETVTTEAPGHDGAVPATVPRTRVTLLTADGLRQFILEDAEAVQVTDPKLRAGIGRALEELRRSSSHEKRHLTMHIAGSDHRVVRVGYVIGAPLWKTTYRLILPPSGQETARLQGWAVLENQSGVDWNGVELTLQSGNPVTFRQALYRSYFVDRPEVPVEIFNRILPAEDTRASYTQMPANKRSFDYPMSAAASAPAPPPVPPGIAGESVAQAAMAAPENEAEETEAEEAVVFRLPKPVVLPAGHSASVPLLDRQAKAEMIDLANEGTTHPLAAIRLTNDTGSGLPPGVLTLYAPGNATFFAGDARVGNLPVGEKRLLSFAQDLHTTIDWGSPEWSRVTQLAVANGMLKVQQKLRTTRKIAMTGPATAQQRVLLAIGKPEGGTLAVDGGMPADTEQTDTAWRLPYDLKAGETKRIVAHIDTAQTSEVALNVDSADQIIAYATEDGLTPTEKATLLHLQALQQHTAAVDRTRQELETASKSVEADEARLRENLRAVVSSDALHSRLIKQMQTDEDKLAELGHQIDDATSADVKARHELADAIASLQL